MVDVKRILFYTDGDLESRDSLKLLLDLARQLNSAVTIFSVVAPLGTNDASLQGAINKIQKTLIDEQTGKLQTLLESATEGQPSEIQIKVVPGKDYAEVIRTAVSDGFDLVVKSVDSGNKVATLLGSLDLKLIRKCPCSVLILKQGDHTLNNVMACVDLLPETHELPSMAARVVELADAFSNPDRHQLHILHVWQDPKHGILGMLDRSQQQELSKTSSSTAAEKMKTLVNSVNDPDIIANILEGELEKEILAYTEDKAIDLMTIGTVSRTGIDALLVGNTAEKVLNGVNCSVLVVKE